MRSYVTAARASSSCRRTRVDDRPILLAHRFRDRLQHVVVARVVLVPAVGNRAGATGKKSSATPARVSAALEVGDIALDFRLPRVADRADANRLPDRGSAVAGGPLALSSSA